MYIALGFEYVFYDKVNHELNNNLQTLYQQYAMIFFFIAVFKII